MRIRLFAIIYTIVMLLLLKIFMGSFGQDDFSHRDMVYYNDIMKQITNSYHSGVPVEDIENQFQCDIVLNDDDDYMAKIFEYYGNYGLVMDFASIGKICFAAEKNAFSDAKANVRKNILYAWIVLFLAGYVFLFALYYNYIRPFRELKHFSGEIAKGNLDVALPIHRANMFGAFTESFDMMREELAASKKREAEAEKSKKELVAQLSHDIKTPVATIKATCEVLELKEKMKLENGHAEEISGTLEKIGYISDKADTIDQLISNMFHATLEELEVLEVTPVETDSRILNDIFAGVSQSVNIISKNDLPECLVYMDKLRMEQVIGNVIGNSIKYAGTDVEVSYKMSEGTIAERKENKGNGWSGINYLCITIRDYGPGVPKEDIYNVTEKFYRGSNTAGKQGSGLGLYLAKFFMEKQMGGFECRNYQTDMTENAQGFVVELYVRKV